MNDIEKSELCRRCGKCCKSLVLPVQKPLQKAMMLDWLDARGCEVVRETGDTLYISIPYPCQHLTKSDGEEYKCGMYHYRPEGCKIFDGQNYDFLDCAWKKAGIKYVIDLNKSRIIGAKDKQPRKKAQWKPWGKIGWKCTNCGHIPGTTEPPEKCPICEGQKLAHISDLQKSGVECPMCGKSAVQVGGRFKRDYLWVRRFRCPKGHIFEEVQ
jgi:rubredoxin